MRVQINYEPFSGALPQSNWAPRNQWPGNWIHHPDPGKPPYVLAFRRRFTVTRRRTVRLHVTADERYQLWLDGERLGQGPERGAPHQWFFESYDVALTPGDHVLVARVWVLGDAAPHAQLSIRPGFILAPEAADVCEMLATGASEWDCRKLGGYTFTPAGLAWGCGANLQVDGAGFDWGFERGEGEGWVPAVKLPPPIGASTAKTYGKIQLTAPAMLPAMVHQPVKGARLRHLGEVQGWDLETVPVDPAADLAQEHAAWQAMLAGKGSLTLPPHTTRRAIIDLDEYYCAYPALTTSGGAGARVRLNWAEALYRLKPGEQTQHKHSTSAGAPTTNKANRDDIAGRYFIGIGDVFLPDGGPSRVFETLWWQAGRYLELVVATADEPLTLDALVLHETRYPLDMNARFDANDGRLNEVVPIAWRCLQMCAHETYMDCPYYEQMMYVGDTRLEALTTYLCAGDDRLGRKAIKMFDLSRIPNGLTQSRYPSHVLQIIPPFSLWWVAMVHDFATWRDDEAFVRSCLPGCRAVLNFYLDMINSDGLVEAPYGWNFMDWVPGWNAGIPPDGQYGVSGPLNWQLVLVLAQAAELETWFGEKELAQRYRRHSRELVKRLSPAFWDKTRSLYADDLEKTKFSEHTQCMALLSGTLESSRFWKVFDGLIHDTDIARCTIYFSHYLFETFRLLNRMEHFFNRMQEWFDLPAAGFKTLPEHPGDSRSDCHAWGAHPLFHYFASILGIRPAGPGFRQVTIFPRLGPLTHASGRIQHPRGELAVDFHLEGDRLSGSVILPKGVTGTLAYRHVGIKLKSGRQRIDVNLDPTAEP